MIARGFGYHSVQVYELLFVPTVWRWTKAVFARPVCAVVSDRAYAVLVAFTKSPHSHDAQPLARSLLHGLRHTLTVFVLVHHGDVRAREAKRATVNHEA